MEELIRRVRAGDGAAFVELMEGQKGTMYKAARRSMPGIDRARNIFR